MAPSAAEMATVGNQWAGTDTNKFTNVMLHKLVDKHAEHRAIFKFAYPINESDAEYKKQLAVTRAGIDKALGFAKSGDVDSLTKYLHDLATKHTGFGVGQTQFQTAKPIIAETVSETVSGADVNAWNKVFEFVIDNLK